MMHGYGWTGVTWNHAAVWIWVSLTTSLIIAAASVAVAIRTVRAYARRVRAFYDSNEAADILRLRYALRELGLEEYRARLVALASQRNSRSSEMSTAGKPSQ